ncbi:MAG: methyltransferase domain-containing protein [Minwuia sp.]|nr:methyltransferase domain-containing protein [Minwuia sp.]
MQDVTNDLILGGRVHLRQPVDGFRSGSDAVMLAAACDPPSGARVLELGCGTGLPMLSLAARRLDVRFTGMEIQPEIARLAVINIASNGWADRGQVVVGDVSRPPFGSACFDMVLANPPYFDPARSRRSPNIARDLARADSAVPLRHWIATATDLLVSGGHAVLIVRRERLDDVQAALPNGSAMDILPLGGRPGRPAKRLLLRIHPDGDGRRRELPTVVLHEADGADTPLASAIMRDAAPIEWPPSPASETF